MAGVRGQALVFDGNTTEVVCTPQNSPALGDCFTISAWVAPQEYSWNLSAIINRQRDFKQGWFFGINHVGQLVGGLALDSGWQSCISTTALPLLKWSHVTLVGDASNSLKLYLDGELAGETAIAGTPVSAADAATGVLPKLEGDDLVVWLRVTATNTISVSVTTE